MCNKSYFSLLAKVYVEFLNHKLQPGAEYRECIDVPLPGIFSVIFGEYNFSIILISLITMIFTRSGLFTLSAILIRLIVVRDFMQFLTQAVKEIFSAQFEPKQICLLSVVLHSSSRLFARMPCKVTWLYVITSNCFVPCITLRAKNCIVFCVNTLLA